MARSQGLMHRRMPMLHLRLSGLEEEEASWLAEEASWLAEEASWLHCGGGIMDSLVGREFSESDVTSPVEKQRRIFHLHTTHQRSV